jgi:hypothetical protein
MAILESRVADLANSLFNVQVARQGHIWSLAFPGGIQVLSSEFTLKGAPDDTTLEDVFGFTITAAVIRSKARGVSMIFDNSDTVFINLTLESFRAVTIKNKIFPKM